MSIDSTREHLNIQAPSVTLNRLDGTKVVLSTLWEKQPLLIFFLRHAGCALCRSHLRVLSSAYPQVQALGAAIAAVTFADEGSAHFLQYTQGVPFPLLLDTSRFAYQAFGMVNGKLSDALGPRILLQQLRQIPNGQMPSIAPGANLTQLGGSVIVDTDGFIQFHHLAHPIDRYPSIQQYVDVLTQLVQ